MTSRPPVIPEITKAYENDPKTQMALAALKAGSSTAPVAGGGWGYADGIARVLQGLAGAYSNSKQEDRYGKDEADLLALRSRRGVDGITGLAQPAVSPSSVASVQGMPVGGGMMQSGAVPPQAAAVAGALGAPAPVAAPMAPAPPQAPAMAPSAQGGGPMGQAPFGRPAPVVSGLGSPPVAAPVPAAPTPLDRPAAPTPVGPVRSRMLDAAYRVMADANPYESASGQDMYQTGLGDQTKLDESAAERAQRIADMGYTTDLGQYADSQNAARQSLYSDRAGVIAHNNAQADRYAENQFTHGENSLNRANAIKLENMRAASAMAVAKVKDATETGGSTALTDPERAALSKAVGDGRVDLKGITKFQAKVVAQSLMDNPNLDGIHLHAAAVLAANPAAQQKAMLAQAIPTVLGNVRDAGKKLNFSDAQFLGNLQAYAKGQFNDPDFVSYMSQRNDAMQTLAQVMSGVGATDMRTKMESEAAPKSMSPKAWDGWYRGQIAAIRPRVEMYEKKGLLSPGATAAMDAATGNTTSGVTPRKPGETVAQYLSRTGG